MSGVVRYVLPRVGPMVRSVDLSNSRVLTNTMVRWKSIFVQYKGYFNVMSGIE